MIPSISNGGWTRYFVRRKEVVKTTWAFKAALIVALVLVVYLTKSFWAPAVAESLVCEHTEHLRRADAVLIDFFDTDYSLFGEGRKLQEAGLGARAIAPVSIGPTGLPSTVSEAVIDALARLAQVRNLTMVPASNVEPISLITAFHIRQFVEENGITSVTVVTPAFRSKRSMMIYAAVLNPARVSTQCAPVFGRSTQDWTRTWHGVQDVALQFGKLQYYRWYVLPFRIDEPSGVTH
jgi:hypothetical protein